VVRGVGATAPRQRPRAASVRSGLDEPNPLSDTLARYRDFFGLSGGLCGYMRRATESVEARHLRLNKAQQLGTEARSDAWMEPVD